MRRETLGKFVLWLEHPRLCVLLRKGEFLRLIFSLGVFVWTSFHSLSKFLKRFKVRYNLLTGSNFLIESKPCCWNKQRSKILIPIYNFHFQTVSRFLIVSLPCTNGHLYVSLPEHMYADIIQISSAADYVFTLISIGCCRVYIECSTFCCTPGSGVSERGTAIVSNYPQPRSCEDVKKSALRHVGY